MERMTKEKYREYLVNHIKMYQDMIEDLREAFNTNSVDYLLRTQAALDDLVARLFYLDSMDEQEAI